MPILGAHMSIAGGYFKAVLAAQEAGCDTVQLFTKNNNQWRGKPMTKADAALFAAAISQTGIQSPTAHNCYLINLASPDDVLWKKSIDAMVDEIRRGEMLGLKFLVTHPGSHLESSVETGLRRVARALNICHQRTPTARVQILLEITAGQGTNLGYRFDHIARILDQVTRPDRLGVCFDTCHAFAAGYAMGTASDYQKTFREFDECIGTSLIKAFHVSDSKCEFGSRVDRHEHIGRGKLGLAPFRFLLNDPRFQSIPMYLETPKGTEKGKELDRVNLRTLRRLVR
jgi:deoxyribonuclease-4